MKMTYGERKEGGWLDSHDAVNKVLLHRGGARFKAKDLRDAVKRVTAVNALASREKESKQMKEAVYLKLVSKNIAEEEKNQLSWCVRIGEDPITEKYKENVLQERSQHNKEKNEQQYKKELFNRKKVVKSSTRIVRPANYQPEYQPLVHVSEEWYRRHVVLQRFVQAVRKVIIRRRLMRRLRKIQENIKECHQDVENFEAVKLCGSTAKLLENIRPSFDVQTPSIDSLHSSYVCHTLADDIKESGVNLKKIQVDEPSICLKPFYPTYDLVTPPAHELLSYQEVPFTYQVSYCPLQASSKAFRTPEKEELPNYENEEVYENLPQYLLEPQKHNELHIFNSLPGTHAHLQRMSYSEIDDDYALRPIDALNKTMKEETIGELMIWRQFPLQSLSATQDVSFPHVPRWSDSFDVELLPFEVPELLEALPSEDEVEDQMSDTTLSEEHAQLLTEFTYTKQDVEKGEQWEGFRNESRDSHVISERMTWTLKQLHNTWNEEQT